MVLPSCSFNWKKMGYQIDYMDLKKLGLYNYLTGEDRSCLLFDYACIIGKSDKS
jgi:hypothetical protein